VIEYWSLEAAADKAVSTAAVVMAVPVERIRARLGRVAAMKRPPMVTAERAVHKQLAVAAAKVVKVAATAAGLESRAFQGSWASEDLGATEVPAYPATAMVVAVAAEAAATMAEEVAAAALAAKSMAPVVAGAVADLLISSQVRCVRKCGAVGTPRPATVLPLLAGNE
jgi:hypothetical protein